MELDGNTLKYNKKQKYLIFDMETANLNLNAANNAWQLAYALADSKEITKLVDVYLKWPELKISDYAKGMGTYNEETVEKEGKDPLEELKKFEEYLYDPEYKILVFNGLNFDIYLHNLWRRSLGFSSDYSYVNRVIDVRALIIADKLNLNYDNQNDNFFFWQMKLLGYRQRGLKSNLELACKENKIEIDKPEFHSAAFDIRMTYEVFIQSLVKKFEIK